MDFNMGSFPAANFENFRIHLNSMLDGGANRNRQCRCSSSYTHSYNHSTSFVDTTAFIQ